MSSPLKGVIGAAKAKTLDSNVPDYFDQLVSVLDALGKPQVPIAVANFVPETFSYPAKFIGGTCAFRTEEVGPFPQADGYVGEYLFGGERGLITKALRDGSIVAAPRPFLAGTGLEGVQVALDVYRSNSLSAAKAVIKLQDE
jgi:hypothetical protein